MIAVTRHEPGQIVWIMFGFYETPEQSEIKGIKINISLSGSAYIYYFFQNPFYPDKELFVKEGEVFESEKELIEYKLSRK